jgi:hypothetical protein
MGKFGTLLAERTIVRIFNLNFLLKLVNFVDFPWTFRYKLDSLGWSQSAINRVVINLNERLLAHDAGGDWRPLGMRLADALLGHH